MPLRLLIALTAVFMFALTAVSQEPTKPPDKSGTEVSQTIPPGSGDLKLLPGPDGKLVWVPSTASLEEYLEFVKRKQSKPAGPPAFAVGGITLEGNSDDDRLRLVAKIRIQVQHEDWVKVPLGLAEAYLIKEPSHEGPGESVTGDFDPRTGYAWWLKGVGAHTLQFDLNVPLRKTSLSRRAALSLPSTVVSSMKLRLAGASNPVLTAEKATVSTRAVNGGTEIEAWGLGSRLDLTWQPQLETSTTGPSLDASTALLATIVEGESATLEATQTVKAIRGTFDLLRVSLPEGYRADRLQVDGLVQGDVPADPNEPQTFVVRLKEATVGPVELKWTLRRSLAGLKGPVSIDGFRINRADIHTGYIAVTVVGDSLATYLPEAEPSVQRQDPARLPAGLPKSQVTSAWRILHQPFRVALSLQKIEPYLSVEPNAFLACKPDGFELDASFKLDVFRAGVSEIQLAWPKWKQQQWTIEPIDPPGLVESLTDDSAEGHSLRMRLVEPAKGQLKFRLKAKRPRASADETALVVLPGVVASRPSVTELSVGTPESYEAELEPAAGAGLRPMPLGKTPRLSLPDFQNLHSSLYRLETPAAGFAVRLVRHARELTARSTVRIAPLRGRLQATQTFAVDVKYERLNQLRLQLPSGLAIDQVRFFVRGGELLPTVQNIEGRQIALLAFDPLLIGRFDVEARYLLAESAPENGSSSPIQPLTIPLLKLIDAPVVGTRLEWADPAQEPELANARWTRQRVSSGIVAWTTEGSPDKIQISLSPSTNPALRGALLTRALIQTRVDPSGSVQAVGLYRLAGSFATLRWSLPQSARLTSVQWNDVPVSPTLNSLEAGHTAYELLDLDQAVKSSEGSLLLIAWKMEVDPLHRVAGRMNVAAPDFVNVVTAETIWNLTLPPNQYLFEEPSGFSFEHQWRFHGTWRRDPLRSPVDLENWIGSPIPEMGSAPEFQEADRTFLGQGSSSRYVFRRIGAAPGIVVGTMSGSALIFLGAGLCAVATLLLVQWSITRHVLTLSLFLAGVSALGVFYPGPVLLLLQPGLAGLALAGVFAGMQHLLTRRRQQSVITLASTIVPSHSSVRPASIVGSNDFTRSQPPMLEQMPVPVESGSRP